MPTEQIDNGVVWSVAVSNGIAYAGGNFSNVRPPGAAAGTNLTARSNLVAINLSTGALVTTWAPSVNGQVKSVTVSPDGTTVYVGGAFTTANGVGRNDIAAFNATTGALITTFTAGVNGQVNSISVTSTTLYVGGTFSTANGNARSRLAAWNVKTSALTTWAPTTDAVVDAVLAIPSLNRVVIGGAFANVNGAQARGSAALDATSAASLPWAINGTVANYNGQNPGAILTLTTDGTAVYGTGYNYGDPSNFEGTFSADPATGNINWLEDCHGDTYGAFPMNGAVYVVSHEHFCTNVGAFPDTNPRNAWYRSTGFTTNATGTLLNNQEGGSGYGNFGGQPSPSQLNWYPNLVAGSFTGQVQAAWAVSGNSQYLVEGGEFPTVNGAAQYGLVRFGVPAVAPNKRGPQDGTSAMAPSILVQSNSTARISWTTNWDQDDLNLTYSVWRDDQTASAVYISGPTASEFWNRQTLGWVNTGLTPGKTYKFWIIAKDPSGNIITSQKVSVTMPTNYTLSQYAQDVLAQSPTHYWRLDDAAGATSDADWAGFNSLSEGTGVTNATPGAIVGDSDTAATFNGTSTGTASPQTKEVGPNVFTESAWINTTTTSGGKILGFGDQPQPGTSSNYDRQLYMDNAGHIVFGVYNNGIYTVTSTNTYNDGVWHQITGTLSGSGMVLYIDGKKIGTNGGTAAAQAYSGYWRVGGDNLNSWPSQPNSMYFAGSIDEVAIYPNALTLPQIQQQYTDAGGSVSVPVPPKDSYGKAVYADNPDMYWRLDETAGPTANDTSPNGAVGLYSGSGVTYQTPSAVTGVNGTGITVDGQSGNVASATQYSNPTVYSEEAWFNTKTTNGGKIIGFGSSQTGLSSSYDRHVFMNGSGQLTFGVYTGQLNEIQTSGSYNDGQWHQVVATQGSDGMNLYVDGHLVGTNPQTQAQAYSGYWRVGGDNAWDGVQPWFAGEIDEVSIYSSELAASDVLAQYKASPIAANQPPVAAFTSSTSNLKASFDGTGSSDPDGTVASYSWDFGDSSALGTTATVSHTYAQGGTYTVTLTVTDDQGATNAVQHVVTVSPPVNQPPVAAFTSSTSNLKASFDGTGSSDPDGTVASYSWDFGDSSALGTTATVSHTYSQGGTYTVTLTVTDDQGATNAVQHVVTVSPPVNQPPVAAFTSSTSNLKASFDGTGSSDPDGTVASYSWDFGDSSALGTTATVSHTYAQGGTYTVTLTVTDDQGATNAVQHVVTVSPPVNQPPVAAFTSSTSNLKASFDGTGSSDPDGTVASYSWDFGDSSALGTTATVSHTYSQGGTYTVTLTVTDDQGATNLVKHSVTVAANQPPTASFTHTCTAGNCTFDGSGSSDPDGTVKTYAWTFGDGTSGTGVSPTHSFIASGTYQVTLTVTDDQGATGTTSVSVPVTVPTNSPPTASFTEVCTNLVCAFDGSGSSDVDGTVSSYSWNFGDGTSTGSGVKPSHTFAAAKTYQVTLTVTDNQGATGSATTGVVVVGTTLYAADSFARTVSNGWGTADTGGAWALTGSASLFSVGSGSGTMKMSAASSCPTAMLNAVSATNVNELLDITTDAQGTGNGITIVTVARHTSAGDYRMKLRLLPGGVVHLVLSKVVGSTETVLKEVVVTGITYNTGDQLRLRFVANGNGTSTMLTGKAWNATTTEPTTAQLSLSDSTAGIQGAGSVGVQSCLASNATNPPVNARFANYTVNGL